LLDTLLTQRIQADLGTERPLIVKNYPLSQAALARPSSDDSDCAARFELFAQGTELANGYDELRDADVLVERTAIHNEKRIANGRQAIELDSSLVAAMRAGLPRCAGVALGVDRLLMIRTQSKSIDETLLFPIEIA
jgi:lysyl-tRNA synthetase class 2